MITGAIAEVTTLGTPTNEVHTMTHSNSPLLRSLVGGLSYRSITSHYVSRDFHRGLLLAMRKMTDEHAAKVMLDRAFMNCMWLADWIRHDIDVWQMEGASPAACKAFADANREPYNAMLACAATATAVFSLSDVLHSRGLDHVQSMPLPPEELQVIGLAQLMDHALKGVELFNRLNDMWAEDNVCHCPGCVAARLVAKALGDVVPDGIEGVRVVPVSPEQGATIIQMLGLDVDNDEPPTYH